MKVLALGAHPDDIEAGVGATLSKLKRLHDAKITMMAFSYCRDELPANWGGDTLYYEMKLSAGALGAKEWILQDYPNKHLEEHRQEILDRLYVMREEDYDIVFTHSSFSSNQDHTTLYNETKRAFRGTTILGYNTPPSDYGFAANPVFYLVESEDVSLKAAMLDHYKSQQELERPYMTPDYVRALLKANGVECWQPWAERFELIRMVVR